MPGDGKEIFSAIEETRETLGKWLLWVHKVRSWENDEKQQENFLKTLSLEKNLILRFFMKVTL
jgi:hypothetical protein